jgi:predicted dehydrogenase
MNPTSFAILGSGWRAEFYLRVAAELPDRFRVGGLLTRDAARRASIAGDWTVPTAATLDELLAADPAFVVLSVPWAATPGLLVELAGRGVPVLTETPPAPDVDALLGLRPLARRGARIQVAEQYRFQPLHAARLAVAHSGRLGPISQVQVSAAHGYHGIDLIRRFLGDGFGPVSIRAQRFDSTIVAGPDRAGPPHDERIASSRQVIATLDFDGHVGVYDFSEDQYFSWIRSNRVLVRGERGEIHDSTVRYLTAATAPVVLELERRETGRDGNLEGLGLVGIMLGEEWVSRNEFTGARLADDELAVATCLSRMVEYVEGGPAFCELAEGVHDHYLGLMIDQAIASDGPVLVKGHLWDEADS